MPFMSRVAMITALLLVVGACSASSTVTTAPAAPTAVPAVPTSTPVPAPSATPLPTATPVPAPTAVPTATPLPTATPAPTATPEPVLFQEAREAIRELAGLPVTEPPYEDFVEVSDDSGNITATVPAAWIDTNGAAWEFEGELVGTALSSAVDIEAWLAGWATPGIFLGASDMLPYEDAEQFLDDFWFGESCTYDGVRPYDDGVYVGLIDVYVQCGDENALFLQLAAGPADGSYLIEGQFLAPTDRDLDAIFGVIESFFAAPN